jgi:predicted TIM-barrel fold metal-dependent hydrolase
MVDELLRPRVREVKPSETFDTRELLRNAARQAEERGFADLLIVDVDAHHYETEAWPEIVDYLEDPVIRHLALHGGVGDLTGHSALLNTQIGNQDVAGRIPRYRLRRLEHVEPDQQRDLVLVRRAMDMMGVDCQVLFPTPMLNLGMHPVPEIEVAVARAYARWITERVLPYEPRVKTMLYLPFNDPSASVRLVEEFAEAPGVVGFMVTTVRNRPVHSNAYMPLYRALEQRRLPLGFHAGYSWQGAPMEQLNRFLSVHALGFVFYSLIHLTNWLVNGIPERFPELKVIWIESGLAWIPFLMQRLDSEYMMRSSEAPLLRRKPSEYMREMYYTSQPMERPDNLEILRTTFDMINAETQLLYSSDYPHWDFDLPSRIYDLPFLSDRARRNILGENARSLFRLQVP